MMFSLILSTFNANRRLLRLENFIDLMIIERDELQEKVKEQERTIAELRQELEAADLYQFGLGYAKD